MLSDVSDQTKSQWIEGNWKRNRGQQQQHTANESKRPALEATVMARKCFGGGETRQSDGSLLFLLAHISCLSLGAGREGIDWKWRCLVAERKRDADIELWKHWYENYTTRAFLNSKLTHLRYFLKNINIFEMQNDIMEVSETNLLYLITQIWRKFPTKCGEKWNLPLCLRVEAENARRFKLKTDRERKRRHWEKQKDSCSAAFFIFSGHSTGVVLFPKDLIGRKEAEWWVSQWKMYEFLRNCFFAGEPQPNSSIYEKLSRKFDEEILVSENDQESRWHHFSTSDLKTYFPFSINQNHAKHKKQKDTVSFLSFLITHQHISELGAKIDGSKSGIGEWFDGNGLVFSEKSSRTTGVM